VAVNVFNAGVPIERVRAGLGAVRAEHEVALDFSDEVLAEADVTDLPFVTLDPITSTDLDQAFCIERSESGFRVRYAIAEVPAFVRLGGAVAEVDPSERRVVFDVTPRAKRP
jgi:exoribonuclease R